MEAMGRLSQRDPFVVVVTGSECTGKSTLARALAAHFGAPCSDEFVRGYLDRKGAPLDASDVESIARGQVAGEDATAARAGALLVKDTDLLSTTTYARHYYDTCPLWIEEAALARAGDLYLLLQPDLPWVADGQRDRPHAREELHHVFRQALVAAGVAFVEVGGQGAARLQAALRHVETALVRPRASASRRTRSRTRRGGA
jgi:NadR type nicotinamide-nucleotide adenylyltransferase